jgi:hypothetical protein
MSLPSRLFAPPVPALCILFLLLAGMLQVAHAAELPTFDVVARNGQLSPDHIDVPAGQRIKLVLKNEGGTPVEFENLDLRVEKVLSPGASSFVIVPSLKPGSYKFVDEFHATTGAMLLIAK